MSSIGPVTEAEARAKRAEMAAEERTKMAIQVTRTILFSFFDDPLAVAFMTFYEVLPEEIEDRVAEILEYLDKTKPEEAEQ